MTEFTLFGASQRSPFPDKDSAIFETLRSVKGAVASESDGDSVPYAPDESSVDFDLWYRSEYGRLVSVLEKLGAPPAYSEDIAAEAFARALERWERVGRMASSTGWTYTVAFNLLRRRQRRASLELSALRRAIPGRGAEERIGVWDEVRHLPSRQREAVVLHYVLDLSYEAIAAVMGISEGTVGATLTAARKKLAERLSDKNEGNSRG